MFCEGLPPSPASLFLLYSAQEQSTLTARQDSFVYLRGVFHCAPPDAASEKEVTPRPLFDISD